MRYPKRTSSYLLILALSTIPILLSSCSPNNLTIFTGPETGHYVVAGKELKQILETNNQEKAFRFEILGSKGSNENIGQLAQDQANHLGIIQSNSPAPFGEKPISKVEDIRIIAPLFTEILFVLVRPKSKIKSIKDLENKQINIGETGSGTQSVARQILDHNGITKQSKRWKKSPIKVAIQELIDGKLDAIFEVSSYENIVINQILASGQVEWLPLGTTNDHGSLKGFIKRNHGFHLEEVAPATFRSQQNTGHPIPDEPLFTLGVTALLVSHTNLNDALAAKLAENIQNKRKYFDSQSIPRLGRKPDPLSLHNPFPFHDGASKFYLRHKPSFIERYAEVADVVISLVLILYTGLSTFAAWALKRNREEVEKLLKSLTPIYREITTKTTNAERRDNLRKELTKQRGEALEQLEEDALNGDSSFLILLSTFDASERYIDKLDQEDEKRGRDTTQKAASELKIPQLQQNGTSDSELRTPR